jgi:hypothetical protein
MFGPLARPSSAGTWLFRTPSGCVGACQRRTEPEAVCKVDSGSGFEMATGRNRSGSFFDRCIIIARGGSQPDNRSGSLPDHILTNQITPRGGRKANSPYQWPGFRSSAVMASDDEGAIAPPTHRRGAHGAEVDGVFAPPTSYASAARSLRGSHPVKSSTRVLQFLGG